MDNLKAQGTKAFIWDFFGKVATHGMAFVVTIFLARLLEPSDFGLVAMVMVIIGIASIFSDVGLGGALIQRSRVHKIHYASVFYFNMGMGVLLALLTYLSAPFISNFYNNPQLLIMTQVMSISFILGSLSSVQTTRLRKELNYALLTKISFISSLISGSLGVFLAFNGAGVWSLIAQHLTQGIVYNILIWSKKHWMPTLEFSWKALIQLWGFGFRMFLSGLLDAIFTRLDYLIIGKLFPPAILGYFQRAKSLNNVVVQYTSGSLMAVMFPVLSKVQNDLPRFQNIILRSLGVISLITFFLLGTLYLVAEELIVLLFSDKWLPSVDYFQILVLSGFAYPVSAVLVNILSSRGNSKAFLRLEIYKKLISTVNFIILYYLGIHAFLYGLIVQAILGVGLNIQFASRELQLPFFRFANLIIIQMLIALVSVVFIQFMMQGFSFTSIISFILETAIFSSLYIFFNVILKTTSFIYLVDEIKLMVTTKFRKDYKG